MPTLLPLRGSPAHLPFCTEHCQVYASLIAPQARECPTHQPCVFCSPIKPGTRVGCTYREPPKLQPWLFKAHCGTVIDLDDPRAWTGTLAFPYCTPTREEVRRHLADCATRDIHVGTRTVVMWDFGKVYWDRTDALYVV